MKKERDQKHIHKRKIPNHRQNDLCNNQGILRNRECEKCNLQYVGQTNKSLRQRMAKHREALRAVKPRRIYNHFNRADHTETDMKVTLIEMVPTEVDILAREQEWINKFRTRKTIRTKFSLTTIHKNLRHARLQCQQQHIHHDADIETRR